MNISWSLLAILQEGGVGIRYACSLRNSRERKLASVVVLNPYNIGFPSHLLDRKFWLIFHVPHLRPTPIFPSCRDKATQVTAPFFFKVKAQQYGGHSDLYGVYSSYLIVTAVYFKKLPSA